MSGIVVFGLGTLGFLGVIGMVTLAMLLAKWPTGGGAGEKESGA